ncbi:MAG: RNA polymerase sigma factor [Limisphaerales bacterium]|jgi:RNA polymerase sigma-70 factor, ECF subfamily
MPEPTPTPDTELMRRIRGGGSEGEEALRELITRWQQPVMNFIHRSLPDPAEAEDLTQGVFIQLWKASARYQPTARFSTFLFTLARNLTLNEIRRRARHPADSLDAPHPEFEDHPLRQIPGPQTEEPTEQATRSELEALIEAALRDLPEKQRTAILLCREGELSYEEIAQVLDTSVQATKSLIHRGREVLKARLKPYLRSGTWTPS